MENGSQSDSNPNCDEKELSEACLGVNRVVSALSGLREVIIDA
jgi:hypothetical protein